MSDDSLDWAALLAEGPPDVERCVSNVAEVTSDGVRYAEPKLLLHCASCEGPRWFGCFTPVHEVTAIAGSRKQDFVNLGYSCNNCDGSDIRFILVVRDVRKTQVSSGYATKLGQLPPFGPVVPSRVLDLIGPDRELFIQGRRAENRGFGIGAAAYYRRVVENQKVRIVKQIAAAARRLGAEATVLEEIETAGSEQRFTSAIDAIKDALPDSLMIRGQNPLTLLHGILSENLHGETDEECLAYAAAVREVLTAMSDRIARAFQEEETLHAAVANCCRREAGVRS